MGIGSIVLGLFAFVCMVGGIVLGWVPFLGTMLSFLAPVLALVGIILGGVALSRAKSGGGESEGLAVGGLVTSIIAFIPSMLVALTCGVCNVCATAMYLDPSIGAFDAGPVHPDGGMTPNGSIAPPPFPSMPSVTPLAPSSTTPTPTLPAPVTPTSPSGQISPGMPPPPLPPGPGTG